MMIYRRITTAISIVMILSYVVFLVCVWKNIPETVPTHFNAAGIADSYGSRRSLLAEPVLMIAMCILFTVIEHLPGIWNFPVKVTEENRDRLVRLGMLLMGKVEILVMALFADAGLNSIFPGFPIWVMYVLLTLMAVTIIYFVIRMVRAR